VIPVALVETDVVDELEVVVPPEDVPLVLETLLELAETKVPLLLIAGFTVTVGKYAARASLTCARAAMKF
jgi:hypothetical protein